MSLFSFGSAKTPDHSTLAPGLGAPVGAAPVHPDDDDPAHPIRISLQLTARDLPGLTSAAAPSAYAVLSRQTDSSTLGGESGVHETPRWTRVAQTETVYSTSSPRWCKEFPVEFRFGSTSVLRVALYDRLSEDDDVAKQRYLGEVRFTLAQLAVLATDMRLERPIVNRARGTPPYGARQPHLVIRGEEVKGDIGESITLQFGVSNLRRPKKPFYILSRQNLNDREFSPVCYSEVNQNYSRSHETLFLPITKSLSRLVNNDIDRELKIQLCAYDRNGRHHYGGSTTFRLKDVRATIASGEEPSFSLRKTRSNGQIVDAGKLSVKKCDISVPYTFLDYINKGVSINTVVAMDMSLTNGHPSDPSSLHFSDRSRSNEYVAALRAVLSVLAEYDTKKSFKSYGFGGKLAPDLADAKHCFPLSGDHTQPECSGIEAVINNYCDALTKIDPIKPCLYGPMFEHVINMTREANSGNVNSPEYTILLMVTDGDFDDFADVANHVCAAADLPLSVVVVGVGNSRFVQLEKLDGDDVPLCSSDGTPCARDLIQFVPFHRHRYNPTQLASEVLDEIPEQLVSFMRSKSIKPSDIVTREPTEPVTPKSWKTNRLPDLSSDMELGSPSNVPLPGALGGPPMVASSRSLSPRTSANALGLSNPMPVGTLGAGGGVAAAGPMTSMVNLPPLAFGSAAAAAAAVAQRASLPAATVGMESVARHPLFSSSHRIQNEVAHGMAMAAVMEREKQQQQQQQQQRQYMNAAVQGNHAAGRIPGMVGGPMVGHAGAMAQQSGMLRAGLGPGPGPGHGAMLWHQQQAGPGMHQAQLFAQHPGASLGAFGGMPPPQLQPPQQAQGPPPHASQPLPQAPPQHGVLPPLPQHAHHSVAGIPPTLNAVVQQAPQVMGAHGVGMYNGGINPGNGDAYGLRYNRRAASY